MVFVAGIIFRNDNIGESFSANLFSENSLFIFNCASGKFSYKSPLSRDVVPFEDERSLWQLLLDNGKIDAETSERIRDIIIRMTKEDAPQSYAGDFKANVQDVGELWFRACFVRVCSGEEIYITFSDISEEVNSRIALENKTKFDTLTGLMYRDEFCRAADELMSESTDKYAIAYLDICRFKAYNDIFGKEDGDRLLTHIADSIVGEIGDRGFGCHIDSDRFAFVFNSEGLNVEDYVGGIVEKISRLKVSYDILCNAGVYPASNEKLSADIMLDRAVMAQSTIKGSYKNRVCIYKDILRDNIISEQEISGSMKSALSEKQFIVYFQPQYNHSTGMLIGAEALVRWNHPDKGLISPGTFIPIFEKNGFITSLDLFVFEEVCSFLRTCIDKGNSVVPISVNVTRHDLSEPDFVDKLEDIRNRYDVPSKNIRIEITESAVVGSSQYVNEIIKKLHGFGYIVEMDDFGSGYSSLNVLKDIDLDIIKLDMKFISENIGSSKGGTILSSIVRMAKWLSMPVIAEGVENVEQADYLRSIGCDCIQGYLYSKPLPAGEYERLISGSSIGAAVPQLHLIETLNAANFWNPKSQETLIFSNFVGSAAIFDYHDGKVEILRVNRKYLEEIGMCLSEKDVIENDPLDFMDDEGRRKFTNMLEIAIKSESEQECETWRTLHSSCCGDERMCLRSTVRMIGKSEDSYLFHAMIRNITAEKNSFDSILESERRFKMASEQVNIYYWEYTIATKEMRPCFRCMRDLGLPPLVTNYPESAIEVGIFPPDYADMYRDMMKQIDNGIQPEETVIPLTVGRVPFRVRYTLEFDENGHAIRAYGSAALVVD